MKRLEGVQKRHREEGEVRKAVRDSGVALSKENEEIEVCLRSHSTTTPEPATSISSWFALDSLLGYWCGWEKEKNQTSPFSSGPLPATAVSEPKKVAARAAAEAQLRLSEQEQKRKDQLAENRIAALEQARIGGVVMLAAVVLRRVVFKI